MRHCLCVVLGVKLQYKVPADADTYKNLMKLIGSLSSAFVRKVRVVMAEKKLEYTFEVQDPWSADSALAQHNPLGQAPCLLLLKPEIAVYDSRVIVEYLDTLSPVGKLIPASGRDRLDVRVWEALADGVLDAAILVLREKTWPGRTEQQRCQAWIDRHMDKVNAGLAEMSRLLGDKPFCTNGVYMTLADVSAGCALGWLSFRFPELDWRSLYPNQAELQERLEQRPSFAETMPQ